MKTEFEKVSKKMKIEYLANEDYNKEVTSDDMTFEGIDLAYCNTREKCLEIAKTLNFSFLDLVIIQSASDFYILSLRYKVEIKITRRK